MLVAVYSRSFFISCVSLLLGGPCKMRALLYLMPATALYFSFRQNAKRRVFSPRNATGSPWFQRQRDPSDNFWCSGAPRPDPRGHHGGAAEGDARRSPAPAEGGRIAESRLLLGPPRMVGFSFWFGGAPFGLYKQKQIDPHNKDVLLCEFPTCHQV